MHICHITFIFNVAVFNLLSCCGHYAGAGTLEVKFEDEHQQDDEPRPYLCWDCNKRFMNKKSLNVEDIPEKNHFSVKCVTNGIKKNEA